MRTRALGARGLQRAQFIECAEESAVMRVAVTGKSHAAVAGSVDGGLENFLFEESLRVKLAAELVLQIVKLGLIGNIDYVMK